MPIPYHEQASDGSRYRLLWFTDEDAESPREWCCDAMLLVYNAGGGRPQLDEVGSDTSPEAVALTHFVGLYGHSDEDRVVRAYALWRAITGVTVQLVTGTLHSGRDELTCFALAQDAHSAREEARLYGQWCAGEVSRYELRAPDGTLIAECGDSYDQSNAESEWNAELADFHTERLRQARSVGAGVIGVI
ncbi:hypothetical protein IU469_30930 [Nocardia puris]|uniref:hypothetical protein n=1 Tax=Nocardia puris TaxID=208602 RepID=UPI001894D992|nr:hypothetical protein [Nocardia puris]MBF6215908.1 hypothetical protein [Nocardia puris]MBF6370089.1 hypothetical protein [Nocardia puris]